MAQETVKVSKEYVLKLTEMDVRTINSNAQGIYVSGTANFQMQTSTIPAKTSYTVGNATTTYVIPDFSQTISGTFKISEDMPVIELRKMPVEEAKRLVHAYVKEHPGTRTSDLIIELELDPDIVLEVLSQLKREQKVE